MAFVDESRATSIIANALKNIMEQTVNVSKVHTQAEITINRGRNRFYSLERKFYILRANLTFVKGIEVIEDFVNSLTLFCLGESDWRTKESSG